MLSISIKSQFPISFTPPSFVGSKWTSWYLYDFSQDIKPKDKLDMINQDKK